MRNNQSPSIHSIYQNALPYYLDRVDICSLGETGESFAQKWVDDLLRGNLAVQVDARGQPIYKLRHLYFESRNMERTRGPKTFGFGFPFFVETFENDLLIAPVFIWHLTLEPGQNKINSWIIRQDDPHFVVPNYKLMQHLNANYDLEILEQFESLALNKRLTKTNLLNLCDRLADNLDLKNFDEPGKVVPSPGIDEIGALSERGTILWSGVLSLFPPQTTRKLEKVLRPEEVFQPSSLAMGKSHHSFTLLPSDPFQASALETIFRNKVTVVEGESASGKTLTLVNLLINALSNGQKCLIVSEQVPALRKIQDLLSKAGINQFNFLLKDALNDKAPLLELLRVAAAGSRRNIAHQAEDFSVKKNRFVREKDKLEANYKATKATVFGKYNWTETVGLFLSSNRQEGKELLSSQLNAAEFDFSYAEYEIFKNAILTSQPLYQKIKTLKHPLNNLNHAIFQKKTKEAGLVFIKKKLKRFLQSTSKLHHRYINKTDDYAAKLRDHYEQYFNQMEKQLTALQEKIADHSAQFGTDFIQRGTNWLSFGKLFSAKKKALAKAKEGVRRDYQKLLRSHLNRQYFEFQFAPCKEGTQLPKVLENLDAFSKALLHWHRRINAVAQEEILRLNSKTVQLDLDYKEQIAELEYALDVLIEELNDSGLYETLLSNKTLTIPQRQKYLESIIEQLENTQLNLRDFDPFYRWQFNWLALPFVAQKLIQALVKVKPGDWMAAFESWYFNNTLVHHCTTELPAEEHLLADFFEAYFALKPLILNQIAALWQARFIKEYKALKRKNKTACNLIFDKNNHQKASGKKLGTILKDGFDAVTATLPLLFATPTIARNVLPAEEAYFDYLIFAEANRFSVERATVIAPLGKRLVFFGSKDSFGSETSLLQYAQENNVPTISLRHQYHAAMLPESIYAEPKLEARAPSAPFPKKIEVENVEGRFDEREGTNDVEAQQVIRLLNQIKRTPKRIYPSVGIVTFTIEQRDLISSYLLKLKQQNASGSEKIKQLERNGMGVYHVDELYGQYFDVLLVSFTLGTVNFKGLLSKKTVFLNSPQGISQLRLIIDKVPSKAFIVHSFPKKHLEKFKAKQSDKGTFLVANFLQYAQAVQREDAALQKKFYPLIYREVKERAPKSIFVREIANALSPYFPATRLLQNVPLDTINLPLSIKPLREEEPPAVVHPDGFFANTPFTSFLWEYRQWEKIKKLGLKYLPVWSVNWWKSPAQEARRLAGKIIKQDSLYKKTAPEKKQDSQLNKEPPEKGEEELKEKDG